MDEGNMVERMLMKGDRIRHKYNGFDFTQMDQSQAFWMNKLSMFSKYRQRIINRYNGTTISSDIKIMFLDQHSMRIGNTIFYNLETSRQGYLKAMENYPLFGGLLGFGFFIGFAYKTPIYSKLYKEIAYSFLAGMTLSYSYVIYHYQQYLNVVSESYDVVKDRFSSNPTALRESQEAEVKNNDIKNFGLSTWNDPNTEDDFEADEQTQNLRFDSDEEIKIKNEKKSLMLKQIYGGD